MKLWPILKTYCADEDRGREIPVFYSSRFVDCNGPDMMLFFPTQSCTKNSPHWPSVYLSIYFHVVSSYKSVCVKDIMCGPSQKTLSWNLSYNTCYLRNLNVMASRLYFFPQGYALIYKLMHQREIRVNFPSWQRKWVHSNSIYSHTWALWQNKHSIFYI